MSRGVDKTREAILQLERERQDRRVFAAESKKKRSQEAQSLHERGKIGDSDFVSMIERFRGGFEERYPSGSGMSPLKQHQHQHQHVYDDGEADAAFQNRINVAVRKRPTSDREVALQDHDSVTCYHPLVYVHSCKLKVDGITKVLENTRFEFDYAFDSDVSNEDIYQQTTLPLVRWAAQERGRSTVFAYGQTGSGKTFTMEGLQQRVARDVFAILEHENVRVMCSNFELYGTQCLDLLNEQRVLPIREDEKNCVHIVGLREEEASSEEELLDILARGSANRTTRATEMNSDSSRSHSIFQIKIVLPSSSAGAGRSHGGGGGGGGVILLVDLAGSERGQDTKHHDATRRAESAAINTSLLSLKECIRALEASSNGHVPYRQSKLTMVLKDSFSSSAKSKTLMIGCVSPAASSTDHTLNTLRYADRVKEKKGGGPRPSVGGGGGAVASTSTTTPSAAAARPVSLSGRASLASSGAAAASSRPVGSRISLAPSSQQQPLPAPSVSAPLVATRASLARPSTTVAAAAPAVVVVAVPAPRPLQYPAAVIAKASLPSAASSYGGAAASAIAAAAALAPPIAVSPRAGGSPMKLPPPPAILRTPSSSSSATSSSMFAVDVPPPPSSSSTPVRGGDGGGRAGFFRSSGLPKTSVAALLDEEDALLSAYRDAVQENFHLLTEESNILTQLSEQVEYDVFASTEELRILLEHKLMLFGDLHQRLVRFQTNVRNGDDAA